mmetsp:Transcript_52375/g.104005  ORF Transcript_52375/g.104005 Transcript_52375/m.104005 type:complete len:252 (+) Transcript_52375:3-758(+)
MVLFGRALILLSLTKCAFATTQVGPKEGARSNVTEGTTVADPIGVWFALGCFWGTQYGLVQFEQDSLLRSDTEVTAITVYAGGLGANETLCYENEEHFEEYETFGYTEAVALNIPEANLTAAAEAYFRLFRPAGGGIWDRPDRFDLGAAYRAGIGIPGGLDGSNLASIQAANIHGLTLVEGLGADPDTWGTNEVFIYDSLVFPPYQAEVCLQFHDDANEDPFPPSYHDLRSVLVETGRLVNDTGCPSNYVC